MDVLREANRYELVRGDVVFLVDRWSGRVWKFYMAGDTVEQRKFGFQELPGTPSGPQP